MELLVKAIQHLFKLLPFRCLLFRLLEWEEDLTQMVDQELLSFILQHRNLPKHFASPDCFICQS